MHGVAAIWTAAQEEDRHAFGGIYQGLGIRPSVLDTDATGGYGPLHMTMTDETSDIGGAVPRELPTITLAHGYGVTPLTDAPVEGDILVRQSTIGSMQLCPGRVGLSLLDGFDHTPSEPMVFGSMVHNLIESFLLLGEDDGQWPLRLATDSAITDSLLAVAEKDGFTPAHVASDEQIATLIAGVRDAVTSWYDQVWTPNLHQVEPAGIERTMTIPLGLLPTGQAVWLQGTPDFYSTATGYDWKTAGRGWSVSSPRYADQELTKGNFSPQAPLYLALIEWTHQISPRRFVYIVYDRSKGTWSEYETVWSDAEIEASLLNAWEIGKQIAAQAFPYTPASDNFGKYERGWHCSPMYCGAWDICPGKAMLGDGYDIEQKKRNSRW